MAEALKAISNYLVLNPKAVDRRSATAWATVLAVFPAIEVRAALATVTDRYPTQIQLDSVVRVLAERCWRDEGLPPPADIALAQIWDAIWDNRPDGPWLHEAIGRTVRRYGWNELYGQETETQAVRKKQVRDIYEAERERVIATWIAELSLGVEAAIGGDR